MGGGKVERLYLNKQTVIKLSPILIFRRDMDSIGP